MKLRIFHILCTLLLLMGLPAYAADVVVVQGERIAPYEEAVSAFRKAAGVRSVEQVVVADQRGTDIARSVRQLHPQLVVAVGSEALNSVREIREIPMVYLMVASAGRTGANATGVTMYIPPARYLEMIRKSFDGRRVGVLYNPAKSGALVRQSRQDAERLGLTLIAEEVSSARQVPEKLEQLKGRVDVLWLIPDPTAAGTETLETLAMFSQTNKVPIVAFAAKYLKFGAVAALDVEPKTIGRQAGEMARKILNGTPAAEVPAQGPADATLLVNPTVARNLRISPDLIKE